MIITKRSAAEKPLKVAQNPTSISQLGHQQVSTAVRNSFDQFIDSQQTKYLGKQDQDLQRMKQFTPLVDRSDRKELSCFRIQKNNKRGGIGYVIAQSTGKFQKPSLNELTKNSSPSERQGEQFNSSIMQPLFGPIEEVKRLKYMQRLKVQNFKDKLMLSLSCPKE